MAIARSKAAAYDGFIHKSASAKTTPRIPTSKKNAPPIVRISAVKEAYHGYVPFSIFMSSCVELRTRAQERILSIRTLYHGMRESFNVFRSSLCISVKTAWPCLSSRILFWSATAWRNRPMKRCRFVPPAMTQISPRPRSAIAAGSGCQPITRRRMSACTASTASVTGRGGDAP